MATNKSTLLWADQARDNRLQSSNENPSTHFTDDGAKTDRSEVTRGRRIRSFQDKSDKGLLPLLQ